MSFVIIEGPDGSGKTTLAHWLAEEYGLEYRRPPTLSSEKGPNRDVYGWWCDQLWGRTHEGGAYDRTFFVSEFVYSLGSGRAPLASPLEMQAGLQEMIELVDLMIFCLPPWSAQKKVLEDEGRLSLQGVDRDALARISWAYEYVYELFTHTLRERVTKYDWTTMTTDHIGDAIEDLARTSG